MVERSASEHSQHNLGVQVDILKQGNSKPIDIDFFIPLYEQLTKSQFDNNTITERIHAAKIPFALKEIEQMHFKLGKTWEEFIQTEIRKNVDSNPHVKYLSDTESNDKKIKIISMPTGSVSIRKDNHEIAEFDGLLVYRDRHPIVVEIKSSTVRGSGTAWAGGHYQHRIKLARDIFPNYGEPYLLKIRSTKQNDAGLTSMFTYHRKIIIGSSVLTDLKHNLGKAKSIALKKLRQDNA